MATLTEEQKARIARNKAEADRRLALRQQQQNGAPFSNIPSTSTSTHTVSVGSRTLTASKPQPQSTAAVAIDTHNRRHVFVTHATNDDLKQTNSTFSSKGSGQSFVPRQSPVVNHIDPLALRSSKVEVEVTFSLIDECFFGVTFTPFHESLVTALKEVPSKSYDPVKKLWSFPIGDVNLVEEKLNTIKHVTVLLHRIPENVLSILREHNDMSKTPNKKISLESAVDRTLVDALFPFQRKGVLFGIQRRGRLLIADEMGLGKTIQALAIMRYFSSDWPLLIVCPSSVKFSWMNQIKTFLPSVNNMCILEKGSDQLPMQKSASTVAIMSYDLMVIKRKHLLEYAFQAIVFDESHMIKDGQAQRTKVATDISKKALRVILLSGTPALSRPVELFSQIRIIDPKIFPNFRDFAIRYCDGKQGRFSFEAKGCTNSEELALILSNSIMIRRLKKDVLDDLPEKRREVVFLNDGSIDVNISNLRSAKAAYHGAADKDTKHQCLVGYYYETGIAKAKSVASHIVDNFFYEGAPRRKVLVFAHHQVVLDTISMYVTKKGLRSIRIDGTTASKSREEQCRLFQEDDDVVVAILSMTAAGLGITLTAATVVVFAELHWNPGTLKQAEDRAHRVGQTDSVFVQYLLANRTADDVMWPLIQRKLDVLGSCHLSSDSYKEADSVQKNVHNLASGIVEYFPLVKRNKPSEDG
uniref:SMARCAL1-like protein n=1 Tax=Ascaris suum TaxID=6253 RepID=F1KXE2_ASCSU